MQHHIFAHILSTVSGKLSISPWVSDISFLSFMCQIENAHTSNHNQSSHVHHCVKLFPASHPVHAGTCSSTLTSNMRTEKTNRWMDVVVSEF